MTTTKKSTYLFRRRDDGRVIKVRAIWAEMEERRVAGMIYRLADGTEATRLVGEELAREAGPKKRGKQRKTPMTNRAWEKPWVSVSAAVHPCQVAEFQSAADAAGTGARYRSDGRLVCESRRSHDAELARRGIFDTDAGHGKLQPKHAS